MKSKFLQFKTIGFDLKFNIWILIFLAATLSVAAFADKAVEQSEYIYLFHLYYDNGQLFTDRDFEFKYDVIPEAFFQESVNTDFPYKGEVVNLLDQVVETFRFDPRRGDPNFTKGKISVRAPYIADGKKVVFYDSQGKTLLTIFVSESSFCDDDGVCNFDRGEDDKTCPNDCRGVLPTTPPVEEPASGQGGMLMAAIYVLIIAGAALGGWFGWKWWKSRQAPPMPPTI